MRKPCELCGLVQIDLPFREGVRNVGREFEYGKVLADEAIKGNPARCFTL
jgi:hypothetical protein